MNIEIERKFLVAGEYKSKAYKHYKIRQGYLSSDPKRVVRIRIKEKCAFLTIKSTVSDSRITRFEWEKEIPLKDAEEMLKFCQKEIIEKTRSLVQVGKHIFEVDEFYGANQGLIIAEVELSSEKEQFEKPAWLGKEVTNDIRYYNSHLISHPYNTWKEKA